MKVGDLVRVKDSVGYNSYMQNLVGHIGVVVEVNCFLNPQSTSTRTGVHILGKTRKLITEDLEVINEGG